MKPFNLEECIAGKPVVTRDGRDYKFGAYNPEAKIFQRLIGWVGGATYQHDTNGRYNLGKCAADLFMKATATEYWVNVFVGNDMYATGRLYRTKEGALRQVAVSEGHTYHSTVSIVIEE